MNIFQFNKGKLLMTFKLRLVVNLDDRIGTLQVDGSGAMNE